MRCHGVTCSGNTCTLVLVLLFCCCRGHYKSRKWCAQFFVTRRLRRLRFSNSFSCVTSFWFPSPSLQRGTAIMYLGPSPLCYHHIARFSSVNIGCDFRASVTASKHITEFRHDEQPNHKCSPVSLLALLWRRRGVGDFEDPPNTGSYRNQNTMLVIVLLRRNTR